MEELKSFQVDPLDPTKLLQVQKGLPMEIKEKLKDFIEKNLEVFAWRHENMVGIDLKISYHHLKIDPATVPYRQKRMALNPERYEALK